MSDKFGGELPINGLFERYSNLSSQFRAAVDAQLLDQFRNSSGMFRVRLQFQELASFVTDCVSADQCREPSGRLTSARCMRHVGAKLGYKLNKVHSDSVSGVSNKLSLNVYIKAMMSNIQLQRILEQIDTRPALRDKIEEHTKGIRHV